MHIHHSLRKRAFSIIELLVAMAVLSLIVLVMAALFQQASVAWKGGEAKSKRYSLMRAALGILERDLASAVDPRVVFPSLDEIGDLSFQSSSMTFFTLQAIPRTKDYQNAQRTLYRIRYTMSANSVEREEAYWNNGSFVTSKKANLLEGSFENNTGGITLKCSYVNTLTGASATSIQKALPAAVCIRIEVNNNAFESYDVGVMSLGPDGEFGTDDDIRVGPQE